MFVSKFIILRLHLTIPLGADNILLCLTLYGSTYHLTYYMEATTDQLSGFPAPLLGRVSMFKDLTAAMAAMLLLPFLCLLFIKQSLNEQLADKSITNPLIVKQLLFLLRYTFNCISLQ